MLEKRVLSRLNAQFVYVAPASGVEVCGALAEKLSLETTSIIDVAERAFRESFNSEVAALLGPKQSDECSTISKESVWTDKSRLKKNGASRFPPLLLNTISRYTEWGKGLDYFIRVAQLAVVELNATQYMFTQKSWERALYSQEPYTLAERLSALPLHELHLFASVARCYARIGLVQAGGNSHSNTYKSRRDPTVNVGEVLDELDRLTGALRRRESTFAGSLQGLLFLVREGLILLLAGNKSTPARVVTNQTIIIMLPPSYEIYEAFQATLEPDLECIGRERFSLMVSDRVRRAVLEPAETPIAIADRL